MKIALTLLIQKEVEANGEKDAEAKIAAIVQEFEAKGWNVSVEDDSEVEGDGDGDGEEE